MGGIQSVAIVVPSASIIIKESPRELNPNSAAYRGDPGRSLTSSHGKRVQKKPPRSHPSRFLPWSPEIIEKDVARQIRTIDCDYRNRNQR